MPETISSQLRIFEVGLEVLSSGIRLVDGGTEIKSSGLRLKDAFSATTDSLLRISDIFKRTRESKIRISDLYSTTLSSGMRIYKIGLTNSQSNLRISSQNRITSASSLRVFSEPVTGLEGNVGVRSLGHIHLANRESPSRGSIYALSSGLRINIRNYQSLISHVLVSGSIAIQSDLRITDTITLAVSSGLMVVEHYIQSAPSKIYIWDRMPTVTLGTFPNVLLDGYIER